MDTRPIGVFDSGLGGLTALRELARRMPQEDLVYFGDTGRVPYGSRSKETIIKYAQQDVAFLSTFDPKAIVIACGTVSTTALDSLRQQYAVPLYGVVEPAARAAAQRTKNGMVGVTGTNGKTTTTYLLKDILEQAAGAKVGLIGTQAPIRSGAYERALDALRPGTQVTARACPLFVPLVENGRFHPGDIVVETVVKEYLEEVKAQEVDTLMLGCTHYPLLREVIGACMGPEVELVDVGAECARWVMGQLSGRDQLAPQDRKGSHRYFVSDSTGDFAALASMFLGEDVTGDVEQIDITVY